VPHLNPASQIRPFGLNSITNEQDCPKANAGKFGEKFIRGSEMEGSDAEAGSGDYILVRVADELLTEFCRLGL
jgi:hypothetical protein